MSNEVGRELGWEDQIENDSPDFVILPEGDYAFEVVDFERARHAGSDKLPPCNKAIVHIKCQGPEGVTTIKHNLFLHTRMEGMLCSFFVGIGQRQHGERVTMNWGKVVGSKGRCKLGIRRWTNDEGKEMVFNEIKKFYEPDAQQTIFTPGKF
jgi:hypothetical protein